MANPDHIAKLSQGAKIWNAWRKENRGTIPDFEGAQFTLSQRQLHPVDKEPVNLQHANLKNAFLYYGQLTKAKLCNADFSGANLSYARLEGADLTAANLARALLDNADFRGADLSVARLAYTDLSKAKNLTQTQINRAKGNHETKLPEALEVPRKWGQEKPGEEPPNGKAKQFVKGHTHNFYALLHVSPLATVAEIRSAYHKLAKQYHPDLNPDNPQIAEEFKRLSAVFKVLSDPDKRKTYDNLVAANTDVEIIQAELFG